MVFIDKEIERAGKKQRRTKKKEMYTGVYQTCSVSYVGFLLHFVLLFSFFFFHLRLAGVYS